MSKPNFNAELSKDSLKELKETGQRLWDIKSERAQLTKEDDVLKEEKKDLEFKANAYLDEYNLTDFNFGPAKLSLDHIASFKVFDKQLMKAGLKNRKIKLNPTEEKNPFDALLSIKEVMESVDKEAESEGTVSNEALNTLLDGVATIIRDYKEETNVYDVLSNIDSKTLNKWANEQKASKEENDEYDFKLQGVEFKEYTRLKLLKNKEDKTKKKGE